MSKWLNQLFEKKSKAKAADGNSEEQTNALLKGLITKRDATLKAASDQAPTDSAITMRARKEAEEEATRIIDHAKQGADEIRKRVTDTLLTVIDRAVTDAEQEESCWDKTDGRWGFSEGTRRDTGGARHR